MIYDQNRSLSAVNVVDFSFFVIFQYPIIYWLHFFWCSIVEHDGYCKASTAQMIDAGIELELWLETTWAASMVWIAATLIGFKFLHTLLN